MGCVMPAVDGKAQAPNYLGLTGRAGRHPGRPAFRAGCRLQGKSMSKLIHISAVLVLAGGAFDASWAQDAEAAPRTRAEVLAELNAARSSGELGAMTGEDSGSFHLARQEAGPTQSRLQVRAELLRARSSGQLDWLSAEDSGSFVLSGNMPAQWLRYAGPNPGQDAPQPGSPAATQG
jgi:hypothetical protein